ncbi:MAG: hypothetical protein WEA31_03935, partial [Pirellulales bacterium]
PASAATWPGCGIRGLPLPAPWATPRGIRRHDWAPSLADPQGRGLPRDAGSWLIARRWNYW